MPRKDSLLRLHERLVARRDALRRALNGDMDSLRAYNSAYAVGDDIDAATDTSTEEIHSHLVEIESRELEQIEHALKRFAEGKFGRCEHCSKKISEPRINALPYVTTCIDCQREVERLGMHRDGRSRIDTRWAALYDREARDRDATISLRDYESDMSESGR